MAAIELKEKENLYHNEDVLVNENKTYSRNSSGSNGSNSGLSSPFGSEKGSTETESEEEDDEFMAELTRRMADYMLDEDDDVIAVKPKKCVIKNFRVSSEVKVSSVIRHDLRAFGDEQDHKIQLYNVENQPLVKKCKEVVTKGAKSTRQQEQKKLHKPQNKAAGILGSQPVVWPPLQTPRKVNYGSDMRAVFLGRPTSNTKTTGTGVFLPRGASNPPPEVRKKLGCSTVLIPARVLHALELHFQTVKNRSPSNSPASLNSYSPQHEINLVQATGQSQSQSHSANISHDIGLPQEWTY